LDLNEAGANFSDEEIRDEVVTMMIAVSITKNSNVCRQFLDIINKLQGSETSTITVCFCLLMLAIHPEIQVSACEL